MRRFDVVVCGAGISGLLIASELSRFCSVLVIEKQPRSDCSRKFWLTKKDCLTSNMELIDCVDSEWDQLDFVANDRSTFTARGQYILWDTRRLESYLINQIHLNNSEVQYQTRLYGYQPLQDSISAFANSETFNTSLIIDCMGHSSPIVNATNSVKILGYHHLYGRTLGLRRPIAPVAVDNVILSDHPLFLEIMPKSGGTANVVMISPSASTKLSKVLVDDFNFAITKTHYADVFYPLRSSEELQGIVPIGRMRKRSLDRILFFGEAGQIHPAASCTCLNRMLKVYKETAKNIERRLLTDSVSAVDLSDAIPQPSLFSQRFHQNLFRQLNRSSSDQVRSMVELLHCLNEKSLDDLIFGEVGFGHFIQADNLRRVTRARNTIWLAPLLLTLFNL